MALGKAVAAAERRNVNSQAALAPGEYPHHPKGSPERAPDRAAEMRKSRHDRHR